MSTALHCPHDRIVLPVYGEGLIIYKHQDDGSYCQLLNRFATTIDDILYSDMAGILSTKRYMHFCKLGATLEEIKKIDMEQDGCLIEFMLIFRRSYTARREVFAEIARLCSEKVFSENLEAQCLFYLVAVVYTEPRWRQTEREYQKLLEHLFKAYGQQFTEGLSIVLKKGEKETGVFSSLLKELRFMQKYVFPLRQADKYSLLQ